LLYLGSSSAPALDQTYGEEPFGIPAGIIAYTMRSSGEMLIDTEGDYVFSIDSIQGHRMWLDGQPIADAMSLQPESTITDAVHLTAGWHDFVVDVQKRGGNEIPKLALSIQSGPVTGAIASDHLRPVVGRAQRFAAGGNANETAITDGGSSIRPVNVVQPFEFVVEDIRFGIQLDHPDQAQLGVILDPPAGPNVDVTTPGALTGMGIVGIDGTLPITSSGSGYSFTISDALADTIVGTVVQAGVTQLGSGGRAPFETSYRFESAIRDLGGVTEFREMQWRLRQGELAASAMQLRTCDVEAECETSAWTDVAPGTIPQVEPRRFAQYGITITTDGDVPTALDVVELRYVVQP
jgi:hypothetical protein